MSHISTPNHPDNENPTTNNLKQVYIPGTIAENLEHYKMIFPEVEDAFKKSGSSSGSELVRSRQRSPHLTCSSSQNNRLNGNHAFCRRYTPTTTRSEDGSRHCSWDATTRTEDKIEECDVSKDIFYASFNDDQTVVKQQSIVTEFNLVSPPSATYRVEQSPGLRQLLEEGHPLLHLCSWLRNRSVLKPSALQPTTVNQL